MKHYDSGEVFSAMDMWPNPDLEWIWADLEDTHYTVGCYVEKDVIHYISYCECEGRDVTVFSVKEILATPWVEEECKVAVVERFQPCGAV